MARKIRLWYNVTKNILQDINGYSLKTKYFEGVTFQEKPIVQLQLVTDEINTPYTLISDTNAFSVSIDNDFNQSTTLMTKTFNADINKLGDWVGGGNALASLGQFSIPIDANTTEFITRLGLVKSLTNTNLELKVLDSVTADLIFSLSFPFYCYNLQDVAGGTPPAPIFNYYDKTQVDVFLLGKQNIVSGAGLGNIATYDGIGQIVDSGLTLTSILGGTTQGTGLNTYNIRANNEGVIIGNARGEYSVDLQTNKTLPTQITLGQSSSILGGVNNTANGGISVIAGGYGNTTYGSYSFIGSGNANSASGSYTSVLGGAINIAQGTYSMVFGRANTANAHGEINLGLYSVTRIANATTWVASENIFALGIGQVGFPKDGFRILKSGATMIGIDNATNMNAFEPLATDDGISFTKVDTILKQIQFDYALGGVISNHYIPIDGGGGGTIQGTGINTLNIRATDDGLFGGGIRGDFSVDLQTRRANATQYLLTGSVYSSLLGGHSNKVDAPTSILGGGQNNVLDGSGWSVLVGGLSNTQSGQYSGLVSGNVNIITGSYSFIGAGKSNNIGNISSSYIGAGESNTILANNGAISGGRFNQITPNAVGSSISGGQSNVSNAIYGNILGGLSNTVNAYGSIKAGMYSVTQIETPNTPVLTESLFTIGNGTVVTPHDAFRVLQNGATMLGLDPLSGNAFIAGSSDDGISFTKVDTVLNQLQFDYALGGVISNHYIPIDGGGGATIDDVAWTGGNWISGTKGQSELQIQTALQEVGIDYGSRTSGIVAGDNNGIVEAYYNAAGLVFGDAILDSYTWDAGYNFENNLIDIFGNTNLTGVNIPTYGVGKDGQALVLNGVSNYATTNNITNIMPTGNLAVSLWVKFNALNNNSTETMFSFIDSGGAYRVALRVTNYLGSNGMILTFTQSNGTTISTPYEPLDFVTNGVWVHVCAIADANDATVTVYRDNVQVGQIAYDGTITNTLTSFLIGSIDNTGAQFLNGTIDAFYYSKSTSFASVTDRVAFVNSLYNAGAGKYISQAVVQKYQLSTAKTTDILANNAKVSNVPTALSTGTITGTSYGITSDGGVDDIILPEANTTQAGLLGAAKWNAIVANTAKVGITTTQANDIGLNNNFRASKGLANGLVPLNASSLIDALYLPAYVDDVLEYANLAGFPATGLAGKIYVALDTNLTYRWSGTVYVEISASLALGITASTAYRGDYGNTAYQHSLVTGNPHGAVTTDITEGTNLYYTEARVSANANVVANTAFTTTPSTVITAGTNLSWVGNTLNATISAGGGTIQGTSPRNYNIRATSEGVLGGNLRGEYSVDLQTERALASQVASGNRATIIGGSSNTASGGYSTVSGYSNTVSGGSSFAVGYNNTASGDTSIAIGRSNIASSFGSLSVGVSNNANSYGEFKAGISSYTRTGQSATTFVATDSVFTVGINGKDGFRVLKNGSTMFGLAGSNAFVTGASDDGISFTNVDTVLNRLTFDRSVSGVVTSHYIPIDSVGGSPTALSTGTITGTSYGITSDGGVDDIILPEANTTQAGLLGAAKWNDIVSNNSHRADVTTNPHGVTATQSGAELALGNPTVDGYVLSSTIAGIRSWVPQATGGSGGVSITTATVATTVTLTETSDTRQILNPTANVSVVLPATPTKDLEFVITNNAVSSSNFYLSVNVSGLTTYPVLIYVGATVRFVFDFATSQWRADTDSWTMLLSDTLADVISHINTANGYRANGSNYGVANGYNANGSNNGVANGCLANGSNYGVANGYSANGSISGAANGYNADGSNYGVANGYLANATKQYGSATGYYSKQERLGGHAKSGDHLAISKVHIEEVFWTGTTADNFPTDLFLHGVANSRCTVKLNSMCDFKIEVSAIDTANIANHYTAEMTGTIINIAGVLTLSTVTTTVKVNTLAISVVLSADSVNGSLNVTATGIAVTNIRYGIKGDLIDILV